MLATWTSAQRHCFGVKPSCVDSHLLLTWAPLIKKLGIMVGHARSLVSKSL